MAICQFIQENDFARLGTFPDETFEWNGQIYRKGFRAAENRYVLIPAE